MFLKSIPDVCMITSRRGELTVEGVASQGNSHIGRLVSETGGKRGGGAGEGWRGNPGLSGPIRRGGNVVGLRPAFPRPVGNIPLQPRQSTPSQGPKTSHPQNSLPKKEAEAPIIRSRPSLNLKSRKEKLDAMPHPEDGDGNYKVWSERVKKMMKQRTHGMFQVQLERLYQEQYKQRLPGDWVKLLRATGLVRLDTSKGGEANPIILRADRGRPGQGEGRQVKFIPTADKSKAEWDDIVITVQSTGAVETNDTTSPLTSEAAVEQLEAKLLQVHLSPSSTSFTGEVITPGEYFSAEVEPGLVRRVKVKKLDRTKYTATCFLIDYKSEAVVPWNCLVPLPQKFWPTKTQAQAGATSACPGAKESRINNSNNNNINNSNSIKVGRGSLEPQVLPSAGEFYGCVLSHVVGPSEVYITPSENLLAYSKMHIQLLAFYSSGHGVSVVNPVAGNQSTLD